MLPNANLKYFRMEQITLPYDVEKHMHEHWELVYYGGLGVSVVDGISFSYLSGSYVVIPPWVPHMETSLAEGALYVVGFESDMGKNELPNELFFDDESQPVRKTLEAIGEEVKKEQPYYSERVNLLLRDLLLQTMRKCAPKAKKTDEKLDMLINYIHAYCTMEIDFKALANSLNYSYDYLRHYFKAQKKMSLKQYVTQRRIALAKEYLASDMPIADVAGKCGFYSSAYFSAVFRQYTGITPTQYHDACCHIHNWNDMILCDPTAHSGRESLE